MVFAFMFLDTYFDSGGGLLGGFSYGWKDINSFPLFSQ